MIQWCINGQNLQRFARDDLKDSMGHKLVEILQGKLLEVDLLFKNWVDYARVEMTQHGRICRQE
jgi:acid phosphatase family membrane protein YuiD